MLHSPHLRLDQPAPKPPKPPKCQICKDQKWIIPNLPTTDPKFGKAIRCSCYDANEDTGRTSILRQLDGLTEQERCYLFENTIKHRGNKVAIEETMMAINRSRGLITLTGQPGVGKSRILIAAVNETRNQGKRAIYTTTSAMLDFLKEAFRRDRNPDNEDNPSFMRRWDTLAQAAMLAVDELDDFAYTEWAVTYFMRLVDERWRRIGGAVTLLALNNSIDVLPDKVRSRLQDGRATVTTIAARDMRPDNKWED